MREPTNREKTERLMLRIGELARGPGRIYLTGGATAVLFGWRDRTVDVDMKMFPEPPGVFEAIAKLKDELSMNIELAAPDQFIPELPEWQKRSRPIATCGEVEFLHYDFYSQALAKIERGHARDLVDARAMVDEGLIDCALLRKLFEAIEPGLIRHPAIDPVDFRRKVESFLAE